METAFRTSLVAVGPYGCREPVRDGGKIPTGMDEHPQIFTVPASTVHQRKAFIITCRLVRLKIPFGIVTVHIKFRERWSAVSGRYQGQWLF